MAQRPLTSFSSAPDRLGTVRRRGAVLLLAALLAACDPVTPKPSGPSAQSALDLMFQNKYAAAAGQLQELIRAHPQDAVDHATYALVLNYETKQKPALDEALKAQKLAPHDGFVLTILTRVEDWNDDIQSAARDGAAAIKAAPNSTLARAFYGEALADVGRYEDASAQLAKAAYEAALKLQPRSALDLKILGDIAVALDKDPTTALKDERAAIAARPTDQEAGAFLVAVLRYLQKDEAAALQAARQTVAAGGASPAPAATYVDLDKAAADRQSVALATGNGYRRLAGPSPVPSPSGIQKAALAHAFYTFFNAAVARIRDPRS